VQSVMNGPALFVSVDPATLSPMPAIGDVVDFTITTMGTVGMQEAPDRLSFGVFQDKARDQLEHIECRLFELHDDIDFRSIRGKDAGRLDGADHMIAGLSRVDFGAPRDRDVSGERFRALP